MGTIVARQLQCGGISYQAKIRFTGIPIVTRCFSARDEAEAWIQSMEGELKARSKAAAKEQALAKSIKRFREQPRIVADLLHRHLTEETIHKKGAAAEAYHVRSILKYPLGRMHIKNLTRRDIREWRDQRLQDVAPSTVNRELNVLNAALRLASSEWDIEISKHVLESVRRPRNPPGRIRRLSPEEEVKLRQAGEEARNPYLLPILTIALETAMRRSEILGMEWERVTLEGDSPSVLLLDTKNGHPRGVPLSIRAVATLYDIRRIAARELGVDGNLCTGSVFPGLTDNGLKLAFSRMVERAGLENFRFHDLRHEATSRLFEKDLSETEVAHITGHKDPRMLLRYTHLQLKHLVAKLG